MRAVRLTVIALFLVACGEDEEKAEFKRQLELHEKRIAALEEKVDRPGLPRSRPTAVEPSTPLPTVAPAPVVTTEASSPPLNISPSEARATADQRLAIRAYCSRRFGSDWQMVERCEKDELAALEKLELEPPAGDLPPALYAAIRAQCADRFGAQFTGQFACQQEGAERARESAPSP